MRSSIMRFAAVLTVILAATGCKVDGPYGRIPAEAIKVVGVPVPFAEGNATKSTMSETESQIVNMALYVFDSDGNKVDYQFIESSKPLFIIDRQSAPYSSYNQGKLAACKLYILANIPEDDRSALATLTSESAFLSTDCTIAGVLREGGIRTAGGLPMWGTKQWADDANTQPIDLRLSSTALNGTVLQLHLNTFMAKMRFNITIDPVQKSEFVQRFELQSWTVENVPAKARVAQPAGSAESAHRNGPFFSDKFTFSSVDNGVNPVMQGGSSPMSFWCYVPEHRVLPGGSVSYPAGMTASEKQNFKPDLVTSSDRPLKITLKGIYTDHRNIEKAVEYTIYPGSDNWSDFYVDRNHEYIHNISIQGISNSKDGVGVSLDCRVDVQQNDFTFTLERETLLDSHWEIRPIRITLDKDLHPKAHHVEVEIMEDDITHTVPTWIRFEMPTVSQITSSPATYCDVPSGSLSYGKRRYFTDNLVTSTLSGNTLATIYPADASNTGVAKEHAIWVYIDENTALPSSPGSNTRKAKVECRYYIDGQAAPEVVEDYYFMQKSLHNVTYDSHTYGIEYFEEYLYNFDARDDYGVTTDGMAWGLENKQLSSKYPSVNYSASGLIGGIIAYIINSAMQKVAIKYDFYLDRDNVNSNLTRRNYSGFDFTKEIATNTNSGIGVLATNADPQSAVEYCFNKNKRKSDGTVDTTKMKWYLPAIDEIEDICKGGYSDFEVFQDKYYWSSQPAYRIGKMDYVAKITHQEESFDFYYDDIGYALDPDNQIGRARATKINNAFNNVSSESHGEGSLLMLAGSGSTIENGPDIYYCYRDHSVNQNKTYDDCTYIIFIGSKVTTTQAFINWSSSTHYYDEGNQPRNAVNRIRCVYKTE